MKKPHPGLALLISGKLDDHDKKDDEEGPSKADAELDAMNHLIDCIHDKNARDAIDCLKDLLEILDCKDEEGEEESDDSEHEPSLY